MAKEGKRMSKAFSYLGLVTFVMGAAYEDIRFFTIAIALIFSAAMNHLITLKGTSNER